MSLRAKTATRVGRVREYPLDLALLSLAALTSYLVLSRLDVDGAVRLLIATPFLLFLPGYALVSVLFPARARRASGTTLDRPRGIDTIERIGLSFVVSLAVVPIVVIVLSSTEWGLGAEPIAGALVAITVGFAQLGAVRRLRVPAADRYSVSPRTSIERVFASRGRLETASALLLATTIVLAAGALVLGLVAPVPGAEFTQLGLYSEDGDGELVAGDVPDEAEANESLPLTAIVENRHSTDVEYTLVAQEQRYEDDEITNRTELETVETTVEDGSSEEFELDVTPTAPAGETVRISLLLYEEDVPDEPTTDNADEDVYVWVTVDGS